MYNDKAKIYINKYYVFKHICVSSKPTELTGGLHRNYAEQTLVTGNLRELKICCDHLFEQGHYAQIFDQGNFVLA